MRSAISISAISLFFLTASAQIIPTGLFPQSIVNAAYSELGIPTGYAAQTTFLQNLETNPAALSSFEGRASSVILSLENEATAMTTGTMATTGSNTQATTAAGSSSGNAAPAQTAGLALGLSGMAVAGIVGAAAFL